MGNRCAAQTRQMRATTQCCAYILGQCANVGSLAAAHSDIHFVATDRVQHKFVYRYCAQLAFYRFALANVFIQRLALMFERTVHGRQLLNSAAKFLQHRRNVSLDKIQIQFGKALKVDFKSETFIGDADADRMLTREYRAPFIVPAAGAV